MKSLLRFALPLAVLASFAPAARLAADSSGDESDGGAAQRVDVVVDLTPAGEKLPHPTRDNPTYYLPLPAGYKEQGEPMTVYQRPVSAAEVEHTIAEALAKEGYLMANKAHPPSIVLMFWWGYVAPVYVRASRDGRASVGRIMNWQEMAEVVRGDALGNPQKFILEENLREASRVARWFIRVSALDFHDWRYHHKITPLWRAHVSTDLWGHYFDEVMPQLVATGVPFFGRATTPQLIADPSIPPGKVEEGTPVFKGTTP